MTRAIGERAELIARGRKIGDHVGVVDRQVLRRLEDRRRLRRYEVVDPVAGDVGVHVERGLVEPVETAGGDDLQEARELDRVARIERLRVERVVAVGIRRGDARREGSGELVHEIDRPEIGRGKGAVDLGAGAVRKQPGIADVDASLPPELCSETDRVEQRPGKGLVDEIGVVEGVVAIGLVVVGRAVEGESDRIDRASQRAVAGIDVLIELLVVGKVRAVFHRQPVSEIVVDEPHQGVHIGLRQIQIRAAVERGQVAVRGERRGRVETGRSRHARRQRGIATIGRALVMEIFVAQSDLGAVVRPERHGRIDAPALEPAELPEGVAFLVHAVEAHGDVLVDGWPASG